MNPLRTLAKKRDGGELNAAEIAAFVSGYAADAIPDYQMAAMAMAISCQGMTPAETAALTNAMLASGNRFTWPDGSQPYGDKHSTGGIGDKTSLLLAPMLACCGVRVPMISGRGLGPTGGTLDKLESIAGFRTDLDERQIQRIVDQVGCVITGATKNLVPADQKLYALRDVTATVPSIPLITASIMSKKLAAGLDALALDVKWGSGAFMKDPTHALRLAQSLTATGQRMGVLTTALITDMNQPLGRMAGNAVEIDEAVASLQGNGPADLMYVTLALGAELLVMVGKAATRDEGQRRLQTVVDTGDALQKFAEMVRAQGGDLALPRRLAPAHDVQAHRAGYVVSVDAERLGWTIIELGGGRRRLGDAIDHSTGIEMLVRLGDRVDRGQPLLRVLGTGGALAPAMAMADSAIVVADAACDPPPLIVDRVVSADASC